MSAKMYFGGTDKDQQGQIKTESSGIYENRVLP